MLLPNEVVLVVSERGSLEKGVSIQKERLTLIVYLSLLPKPIQMSLGTRLLSTSTVSLLIYSVDASRTVSDYCCAMHYQTISHRCYSMGSGGTQYHCNRNKLCV